MAEIQIKLKLIFKRIKGYVSIPEFIRNIEIKDKNKKIERKTS